MSLPSSTCTTPYAVQITRWVPRSVSVPAHAVPAREGSAPREQLESFHLSEDIESKTAEGKP